jgi:metal-responsive CopG/Arc/MetJ family transcriptional regulator
MKTAISIPDNLFDKVETMRKKHHLKRSQFITLAVRNYIKKIQNECILNTLNEVYSDNQNNDDDFINDMTDYSAKNILEKESW